MARQGLNADAFTVNEADLARLAPIAERLLAGRPTAALGAETHRRRPGQGSDFLDFQPYSPGADRRAVDWRASARSGRIVVRRYRRDASAEWSVCLDRSPSMAIGDGRKWRIAAEATAAWLFLLLRFGKRAALLLFSDSLDMRQLFGRGRGNFAEAVSRLAACAPARQGGGSNLGACLPYLAPGSSAIVVSDFLTPDGLAGDLERLRRRGIDVHAVRINATPVDAPELPAGTTLVDVETGEPVVVGASGAAAIARVALARHREALATHCRRLGIPLSAFDDPPSWQTVVGGHLRRLADHDA